MKSGHAWMRYAPALCLGLGACLAPPVETPTTKVVQETDVRVEQNIKNKVDILFMIDDSPSMMPKQMELQKEFPKLINVLQQFGAKGNPAWYHIGVVTSDLGAGMSTSTSNCKPGGLGGRLQALGKAHASTCGQLGNGLHFIDYNQLNGTNNLPAGQDLPTTFTCMASVGDTGCGFEHQLEAPYKALHDCMPDDQGNYPNCTIPENQGFLRPDSILAVVYLTDEDDDCSAPPDTDLFDLNKTGTYGQLLSYRGTQYGVMCNYGSPPMLQLAPYADSGGPLMGCVPAPNPTEGNQMGLPPAGQGKCYDVNRYIDFFSSGGNAPDHARKDPTDVILAAIAAPPTPFQTIVGDPGTYQSCAPGQPVDGTKCAVLLQHSCFAPPPLNTTFFGDPAVRISSVVNSAKHNQFTSICDTDYSSAIIALGNLIVSQIGPGCLSSPVTNTAHPDCVVEDLSNADNTLIDEIPFCDPMTNTQPPCWQYVQNPMCPQVINPADGSVTQGSITIMRDPSQIPVDSHARVACATLAHQTGQVGTSNPDM